MGNPEKRAKRAKLKAKQANIQRQRARSQKIVTHRPSPEIVQLFERMPPPIEKENCLAAILEYIENDPKANFEDLEAAVLVLYSMYKNWRTEEAIKNSLALY